jgi:hypothetical protein
MNTINNFYIFCLMYLVRFLAALEFLRGTKQGSMVRDIRKMSALLVAAEMLKISTENSSENSR